MSSRPAQLTTLEPDGLVLEELIENMQDQYGTPSTPQEYRLTIKVASREEVAQMSAEADQEAEARRAPGTPGSADKPKPRRRRGRRRGRRRAKPPPS